MTNAVFNNVLRERTRLFAVVVFRFLGVLPPGISNRNIAYQLADKKIIEKILIEINKINIIVSSIKSSL